MYDRVEKQCTDERVFRINGIYLDLEWNPEFSDTDSEAFSEMALEREFQLYVLMKASTEEINVRGLKVIKATKGAGCLYSLFVICHFMYFCNVLLSRGTIAHCYSFDSCYG